MTTDTTFKPSIPQKVVWWTIESKQNSLAVAVSVISFFAVPKFSQISYVYSFLVCSSFFYGLKFYLDYQKRITEERFHEHYQVLTSYCLLDYNEMKKIFKGYALNKEGHKLDQKDYSKKKKKFVEVCETFKLVPIALDNAWVARPKNDKEDSEVRLDFIMNSIPDDIKSYLNKLEKESKAKYPDI